LQKEKPYRHKLLNSTLGDARRCVRVNQKASKLNGHTPDDDDDNLLGDNIDIKKYNTEALLGASRELWTRSAC
jgi:hypothetical protein